MDFRDHGRGEHRSDMRRQKAPTVVLIIAAVLYTIFLFTPPLHAQNQVTQTITVGVVFVEFSDAVSNVDARGGVGYTAPPRIVDTGKYQASYWYDYFFKEEGHVSQPDSVSHQDVWSGGWAPYQLGSLSRWCRENSYGRHEIQPYSANGKNGVLNSIDTTGKIEWIRLNNTKSALASVTSILNPLAMATYSKLDSIFTGMPSTPTATCDVIIIVYAGVSFGTYYTREPPGAIGFAEKTPYNTSYPDAILNLTMGALVHEYVHAVSDDLLDASSHPANYIKDYGYDYVMDDVTRARWLGISAMYGHGLPNRPLHLDPWAKLMLGWIDYQILEEGEYEDLNLPIIAQPANGVVPHVLVIPIDVPWSTETPDWYRGHYLIIENRRRIDNSFDMTLTDTTSAGGMVVWEYDEQLIQRKRGGLTVVEADGKYDMKFLDHQWVASQLPQNTNFPHQLFDPTADDFWDAPSVLSTWS